MPGYLFLNVRTFLRQHTTVLLGRPVAGTGLRDTASPGKPPFSVHLGKVAVQLLHPCAVLVFVLSGKNLLVCKLAVSYRQKRTMYVRVLLVKMCNESCDILLSVFVRDEPIGILRPQFYFRLPHYAAIVRALLEIHLLLAEGELTHQLTGAAENDVDHRPVFGLQQSLVRVFNTTLTEIVCHAFRNAPAFVHRAYFSAVHYLKIQMFPCRVVVAFLHGIFRRLLTAVAQMFITLGGSDAFGNPNVENLFCICHTFPVLFRTILRVPACCPVGHRSQRRSHLGY